MWHVVWNRQDFKWPFKPALFTVTRNILVAVGSLAIIIITIITILILLILVLFLSVWATSQSFTDLTVDSGGRPDGSQKPRAQLPSNGDCLWPYCSLQGRDPSPCSRRLTTSGLCSEQVPPKKKQKRAPKFKNNNMLDYVGWNDWDHGMIMWYNLVYVYMRIILLTPSPKFFGMHSRPWHSSSAWLHTRTASVAELVPSWDAPRC